jgi:hypothetical protein
MNSGKNASFSFPPAGGRRAEADEIKVKVTDLETNISTTYDSINAAARALNIPQSRIIKYFAQNQKKPNEGRYVFTRGRSPAKNRLGAFH